MMNSALLCFFAICAICLVDPSAGGPLGGELVAINNNGQVRAVRLPPLIHVDHPSHPIQLCEKHGHPKSVVTWAVMNLGEHVPDNNDEYRFCSERIVCISRNNRHWALEIMADGSMEGVQCRPHYASHTHRHMCIQGDCVRVEGLFPNAPTDQDEAKFAGPISKDYLE